MIAWIIVAAVAVPLLVIAFLAARRSRAGGERPAAEVAADLARDEREFAEAERYQEQWRKEQHSHQDDTRIP